MKANQLKVNNYVQNGFSKTIQVKWISEESITGYNIETIKPIPLTEEWLTNLGAENYKEFFIHDRFMLQWIKGHNYWYVTDAQFKTYITKIEFVHEWQNLFFTLTQKELTL